MLKLLFSPFPLIKTDVHVFLGCILDAEEGAVMIDRRQMSSAVAVAILGARAWLWSSAQARWSSTCIPSSTQRAERPRVADC
jgi:hypothetical protein